MRSTWPPLLTARCRRSQSVSLGDRVVRVPLSGHASLHAAHGSGNLPGEKRPVLLFTSEEDATTSSRNTTDGRAAALARRPYGAAAFKVSSRGCLHVAQLPVGAVTPGVIDQTVKCILGLSVVAQTC